MKSHWRAGTRHATRSRAGFTLIELMFVVLIVGVLGVIAFPRFTDYLSARQAANARDAFAFATARARAAAIERGEMVVVMIRVERDSVFVLSADATDTLEVVDYKGGDFAANVLLSTSVPWPFRICYVPRGFAHPGCGEGDLLPEPIGFASRYDTVWATINGVGQVER